MSNRRLIDLREYMKKENVDICIIYSTDSHNSEYISNHYKFRDYISGFTGSAATLVIEKNKAFLWTDGRYFLQAEAELENSDIELCKSGEKGVLEPEEYIKTVLEPGMHLGIDARTVPADMGIKLDKTCKESGAILKTNFYPSDFIWNNRPDRPAKTIKALDIKYSGYSAQNKLNDLREKLKLSEKEAYILSSLDDIAWLLNLRGSDIPYNPVFYSYFYMDNGSYTLFVSKNSTDDDLINYLESLNVHLMDYEEIYKYLSNDLEKIYIDETQSNYAIYSYASSIAKTISISNPCTMMKAIKNETECNNLRYCNEIDGVAIVRFLMWIENECKSGEIDEYTAGLKLDEIRTQNPACIEPSFETICGYEKNGAIIHYTAKAESAAKIYPVGSLLVDSGGQYLHGTTDITRTFSLGNVSDEYKHDFTLVLKGMLALQNCIFLEGATGGNLDILARQSLWQEFKNYKHGTGHGIGYFLNVHEDPVRISYNVKHSNTIPLQAGMVSSNEPGLYIENKYGIRLENMLLCKKLNENSYGSFLGFEPLTYAPIDLSSIKLELLNDTEKKYLNDYHELVYNKLSLHLNNEERAWLKDKTRAI